MIDDQEDLNLVMPMYNLIKNSLNYSDTTDSLCLCSKDEANNFNDNITNSDAFKCKGKLNKKANYYETQLLIWHQNSVNGILKSLEILSINCKPELKLKGTKHCVLSIRGTENADANSDNIIFIIKDKKLYIPAVTVSKRQSKASKKFERLMYLNECKTKTENKIRQTNIDIFSNQNSWELANQCFDLFKQREQCKKV